MKNELKQELTRRLCACNNGGLVLVMYDIYFGFSDDEVFLGYYEHVRPAMKDKDNQ